MEKEELHFLKIEDGVITLDGIKLKGIINYAVIKNSAVSPTEFMIKLIVND